MNGRAMPMERVPLTEPEKEYLSPIIDRWEQVQRDAQEVQKSIDAVVKLFMAQHKDELHEGPEGPPEPGVGWQLGRDAFVRPLPPAVPPLETPPPVGQATGGEDEGNGSVEEIMAELMEG